MEKDILNIENTWRESVYVKKIGIGAGNPAFFSDPAVFRMRAFSEEDP